MAISAIDESQRRAAKVVGYIYLIDFVLAVFAEFYLRGHLIVYSNPAATARNIMAHEQLFRLSIAIDLVGFASVVALLTALYVVLRPVNRNLALLAAFWRLVEASVCVVMTLSNFDVLRLLRGTDYLRVFQDDQLQALARISIGAHDSGYSVAMIFFGLGSTVFCSLWFRSGYVPKALAVWGVVASLLIATFTLAFVVFPNFENVASPAYFLPIATFELTMGFWLLLRGLRPTGVAQPAKAGV